METQICHCCGKELPISQMYRNQWGYTDLCKSCFSKKASAGKKNSVNNEPNVVLGKRKRISKQMRRIAELEAELESVKNKRLSDFQPRELLSHLKHLGYKWEKLIYTKIEYVDYNKIE